MSLPTNYQDDILNTAQNTHRVYNIVDSEGNIVAANVHLTDETVYTQRGSLFAAIDVNNITNEINNLATLMGNETLETEASTVTGAINELKNGGSGVVIDTYDYNYFIATDAIYGKRTNGNTILINGFLRGGELKVINKHLACMEFTFFNVDVLHSIIFDVEKMPAFDFVQNASTFDNQIHIVGYATIRETDSSAIYTDPNSLTGCNLIGNVPIYCRNKIVTSGNDTKYLTEMYILAGPNASDAFSLSSSDVSLEMDVVLTYYCKEFEGVTA